MNSPNGQFDQAAPSQLVDHQVWHVLRPEIRSNPLRLADLKLLAAQQQLRHDDLIWHPTWEQWRPAHELPGLFPTLVVNPVSTLTVESHREVSRISHTGQQKSKPNVKERARHEMRSFVIITVYVWIILSLLRLHAAMLADQYHFRLETNGWTIVTALILGKVVLIAEALRFGDRIAASAPAFAVAIKSMFFALAILLFHGAEHVVSALWHGEAFGPGLLSMDAQHVARSVVAAGIMTIALMPYFLIKEIEKRTGETDLLLMAVGLRR